MIDQYGRTIDYLRLSVTDLCNYRCQYCMPADGVEKGPHGAVLSVEECGEIARAAVKLGIRKIRLTGGEPLVRRGILDICRTLRAIPELKELCLTTNGSLLPELAKPLQEAGVDRLNISLDTLRTERFREITRRGDLDDAFAGIRAAEDAGFQNLKLDTVLMGGLNDDEIEDFLSLTKEHPWEVRFIELMPIGQGRNKDGISEEKILGLLEQKYGVLCPYDGNMGNGPAHYYELPGFRGKIGFISAISHKFCGECNRVRLTSDGGFKTCLQYGETLDLRSLLRSGVSDTEIREQLEKEIQKKPQCHHFENQVENIEKQNMSKIGG